MGLYAEPKGNKRKWFNDQASPITHAQDWSTSDYQTGPVLPVAMLNNGYFIALAVLWSKKEYNRVTQGREDAVLGLVSKEILRGVVPGGERLKELKCLS